MRYMALPMKFGQPYNVEDMSAELFAVGVMVRLYLVSTIDYSH